MSSAPFIGCIYVSGEGTLWRVDRIAEWDGPCAASWDLKAAGVSFRGVLNVPHDTLVEGSTWRLATQEECMRARLAQPSNLD